MNKELIMTQETLERMERCFLKEYFYNIPEIPVEIIDQYCLLGAFCLEEGDDYDADNDELIDAYEYRSKYITLCDGLCGYNLTTEPSYTDPLNHPKACIKISTRTLSSIKETVKTLMHELLHYYLWYIGWDYNDEDLVFDQECRKMGLATNYGYDGDDTKIQGYIKTYMRHVMLKILNTVA